MQDRPRLEMQVEYLMGCFLFFQVRTATSSSKFFYPGPAVGRGMGPPRVGQNFEAVAWFLNEQEQEGLCLCFLNAEVQGSSAHYNFCLFHIEVFHSLRPVVPRPQML